MARQLQMLQIVRDEIIEWKQHTKQWINQFNGVLRLFEVWPFDPSISPLDIDLLTMKYLMTRNAEIPKCVTRMEISHKSIMQTLEETIVSRICELIEIWHGPLHLFEIIHNLR